MKRAICLLPLPLSPLTCFNFTSKQVKALCSQTSRTLQHALLMEHAFFIIAMALTVAKDAHCTWLLSTSKNHPLIGNHQCVGSYQSRLIGKCAKTMWKWPLFADGHVPTGATTAQKWRGVARRGPMHMSVALLFSTVWAMNYQRLSAPKSSYS